MKKITVYQSEYQPDVYENVGEDYQVTVLERQALKIQANGDVVIYNAHAWHSVTIQEADRG